jgi:hypothetical protein
MEMEVQGDRRVEHAPLAAELRRQTPLFEAALAGRDTAGDAAACVQCIG